MRFWWPGSRTPILLMSLCGGGRERRRVRGLLWRGGQPWEGGEGGEEGPGRGPWAPGGQRARKAEV